jgi:hypothetical protein
MNRRLHQVHPRIEKPASIVQGIYVVLAIGAIGAMAGATHFPQDNGRTG